MFGGCTGEWSTQTVPQSTQDRCSTWPGPGGATVSAVTRLTETGDALTVTTLFPDGSAVAAIGTLGDVAITGMELANIITDPAYVAGLAAPPYQPAIVPRNSTDPPRTLPDDPVIGVAYPFDLYSHCGIDLASFAGHVWRSVQPDDGTFS
jgi:hypothetical protein